MFECIVFKTNSANPRFLIVSLRRSPVLEISEHKYKKDVANSVGITANDNCLWVGAVFRMDHLGLRRRDVLFLQNNISVTIYSIWLSILCAVLLCPNSFYHVTARFLKTICHTMCPRNFNCLFPKISIHVIFVAFSLNNLSYAHVSSMVFSASLSRTAFRLLDVSSSSVSRLFRIYWSIGGMLL